MAQQGEEDVPGAWRGACWQDAPGGQALPTSSSNAVGQPGTSARAITCTAVRKWAGRTSCVRPGCSRGADLAGRAAHRARLRCSVPAYSGLPGRPHAVAQLGGYDHHGPVLGDRRHFGGGCRACSGCRRRVGCRGRLRLGGQGRQRRQGRAAPRRHGCLRRRPGLCSGACVLGVAVLQYIWQGRCCRWLSSSKAGLLLIAVLQKIQLPGGRLRPSQRHMGRGLLLRRCRSSCLGCLRCMLCPAGWHRQLAAAVLGARSAARRQRAPPLGGRCGRRCGKHQCRWRCSSACRWRGPRGEGRHAVRPGRCRRGRHTGRRHL